MITPTGLVVFSWWAMGEGLEVAHDLHRRAFGDADEIGDVADAQVRSAGDREEHVGVVGEERPGRE